MGRRWVAALLAVAVAAALYAYLRWFDRPAPAREAQVPDLIPLLVMGRDEVTGVDLAGPGYRLALRRSAEPGGAWQAVLPAPAGSDGARGRGAPDGAAADGGALDGAAVGGGAVGGGAVGGARMAHLLERLTPLHAAHRVAETAGDPATWGLDHPTWTITVYAGAQRRTLTVGAYQPVNHTYYAQRDDDPAVYLIPATLPDSIPPDPSDWFQPPGI